MTNQTGTRGDHFTGRMANPQTRVEYFEIYSRHVADKFGISVSLPQEYATQCNDFYPLLYATDGNSMGTLMEAGRPGLVGFDAVPPVRPYVQVNIGYTAEQAPQARILRNRDLIPPGEGMPEFMASHVRKRSGADASESEIEAYLKQYKNSRADNFLAFVEDELHPEISRRYRVRPNDVGLFGYSSGGLFSLYALTSGSQLFSCVGASSPGIHVPDSTIFARYNKLLTMTGRGERKVHLHLTVNAHELLGPVRLYRLMGINLLRFLDMINECPLRGLRVTSEMILGESHASGVFDAYRSFLRRCYAEG
jgi:uncharacterized protein